MKAAPELFNRRSLEDYLDACGPESMPAPAARLKKLTPWATPAQKARGGGTTKETGLEAGFITDVFRDILGYPTIADGGEPSLFPKQKSGDDTSFPDAILGFDRGGGVLARVVVELKSPGTDFEKKQPGMGVSPVEQAFAYAPKNPGCRWIILTDFVELRLYNRLVQREYERFSIADLADPTDEAAFKKFYFLLSKDRLIAREGKSPVDELYERGRERIKRISNEFYKTYKHLRSNLFDGLVKNNGGIEKLVLFAKAQTILDRIIFICFCEHRYLLPKGTLNKAMQAPEHLFDDEPNQLWPVLKGLFAAIDSGRPSKNINGYNGGLFKNDETLNALTVPDAALLPFKALLDYDYESELNVNILGHIFEQSIADIETIKAKLLLAHDAGKRPKRKAEGIFYTPPYVTRHIVEKTVGAWLASRRALRFGSLPEMTEADRPQRAVKKGVETYSHTETNRLHHAALEEYRQDLLALKLLDPACGSGAFLNEAFGHLLAEGKRIDAEYGELQGEGRRWLTEGGWADVFDWQREILSNCVFGVDINTESVEITKLSLWLNSAQLGRALNHLDSNIKVGDSIIDDVRVAGAAAFTWAGPAGFPGVMAGGGFDVIVGNPPYINIDVFGHGSPVFDHLKANYADVYMDKSDILFYFIKKSIDLLKDGGVLGFIVSNAFLFSDKAKKLRNHILDTCSVLEIVNFEQYMVFQDAGITTCIIILQKNGHTPTTRALTFKNKELTEGHISETMKDASKHFDVAFTKDAPFALIDRQIAALNERIDGGHKKLGQIVRLGQGMITAADEIFSFKAIPTKDLPEIDKNHKKLGELLHVGKGMETAADEVFSFKEYPAQFPPEFIKKRVSGKNIDRYYIDKNTDHVLYFEDIKLFEHLPDSIQKYLNGHKELLSNRADAVRRKASTWWKYSFPIHKELYHSPKIVCSRRAFNNIFVLDNSFEYIPFSNMTVVFCTDGAYLPEYILALLNSKLLTFRYRSIGKQTGGGSYEYFPNGVEKLPIAWADQEQQRSLADKARRMMELKSEMHGSLSMAQNIPKQTFGIKKLPKPLDAFHLLDEAGFLGELKNAKVDLMAHGTAAAKWFSGAKAEAAALAEKIQELDDAIDAEVYALYRLEGDDIRQVEQMTR